jgi:hypothetical protein
MRITLMTLLIGTLFWTLAAEVTMVRQNYSDLLQRLQVCSTRSSTLARRLPFPRGLAPTFLTVAKAGARTLWPLFLLLYLGHITRS